MNSAEMNAALGAMDPTELALGAGLVGVIGTLMLIGSALWFLVSAIGYFKMFKKAGLRGWFAFIPLLRDYNFYKMAWNIKTFIIATVLLAAMQLCGESESVLAGLVAIVTGIAFIVITVKMNLRVAKAFGKGALWGILLLIVPFIASLILGFGSAEYLGNPSEEKLEGV